jgi:hypothetical protein
MVHTCIEKQQNKRKKKEKQGQPKLPLCYDLAMAPTYTQKKKKLKKGKRGPSSFFAKSW